MVVRYTPLSTKELLEAYAKQSMKSWVNEEGPDAVAEAESAILESLSSHARAVIATSGGKEGAAGRVNKWRHIFAGFTVWLSLSEATDEESAKEEAKRNMQDSGRGYSNAEVVVKLGGWDPNYSKAVAQAVLSAFKRLILACVVMKIGERGKDEESAKVEAKRNMQDSGRGYSNAEVVVNLGGWDPNYSKAVAHAA
ncbi:hypothetical protein K7X08_020916 [Anisodus acutangulus]|uniref:Uncharacterized protein n=1 Tax=Anisodus acutangulus TaxID=402998 RepID=A0A9Q1MXM2_9SOLA|nr:hypothetical protein K7X08_020916 [Anisodus acutangulus]